MLYKVLGMPIVRVRQSNLDISDSYTLHRDYGYLKRT
jgi:hypothetical protein